MKIFQEQYTQLLINILSNGISENNKRTNHDIFFLIEGSLLTLDLSQEKIPIPGIRKVYPKSASAEVAWFIQGHRHIDFIKKYAPLWNKFVEKDGVTVHAAYGYRYRYYFKRDQLFLAVKALLIDPSDRQVIVMAWDPASDALGSKKVKNVPCPLLFQLFSCPLYKSTHRALNMSLYIRSSDVFVGLPYDVMGHAFMLYAFVEELNKKSNKYKWQPGIMQIHIAHPHLYKIHMASTLLAIKEYKKTSYIPEPKIPEGWSLTLIEKNPDNYVEAIGKIQKSMIQPIYSDNPKIIE